MRSDNRLDTLTAFKRQLTLLEHHLNAEQPSPVALSMDQQRFLQTFVSYAPHFYHRYIFSRSQDRGATMRWGLRFMKIALGGDPNQKMALMEHVSANLDTMTRAQVADYQRRIFAAPAPSAASTNPNPTCQASLEPSPAPRSDSDERPRS
jgi:hypothetical protein